MRSWLLALLFVMPLFLAVELTMFGLSVFGRDDANYLAELVSRSTLSLSLDFVSWSLLSVITGSTFSNELGLRIAGLVIAGATILLVRSRFKLEGVAIFMGSVLPLYFVLYFNQLRVAIALMIFIWLATSKRLWRVAAPVASLGHSSFVMLFYPPLILAIPAVLYVAQIMYPNSIAAAKAVAYATTEQPDMPWYFGWELLGVAIVFLLRETNRWKLFAEVMIVAIAVRIVGMQLSVDVGRRLLELGILAYSPIFLILRGFESRGNVLLAYFVCLGVLQSWMAILNSVVYI